MKRQQSQDQCRPSEHREIRLMSRMPPLLLLAVLRLSSRRFKICTCSIPQLPPPALTTVSTVLHICIITAAGRSCSNRLWVFNPKQRDVIMTNSGGANQHIAVSTDQRLDALHVGLCRFTLVVVLCYRPMTNRTLLTR